MGCYGQWVVMGNGLLWAMGCYGQCLFLIYSSNIFIANVVSFFI